MHRIEAVRLMRPCLPTQCLLDLHWRENPLKDRLCVGDWITYAQFPYSLYKGGGSIRISKVFPELHSSGGGLGKTENFIGYIHKAENIFQKNRYHRAHECSKTCNSISKPHMLSLLCLQKSEPAKISVSKWFMQNVPPGLLRRLFISFNIPFGSWTIAIVIPWGSGSLRLFFYLGVVEARCIIWPLF